MLINNMAKTDKKGGFLRTILHAATAVKVGTKLVNSSSKSKPGTNNVAKDKTVRVIDLQNNKRFTLKPTSNSIQFYNHGNSNKPVGEIYRNNIRKISVENGKVAINKTNNSKFTYKLANNTNQSRAKQILTL